MDAWRKDLDEFLPKELLLHNRAIQHNLFRAVCTSLSPYEPSDLPEEDPSPLLEELVTTHCRWELPKQGIQRLLRLEQLMQKQTPPLPAIFELEPPIFPHPKRPQWNLANKTRFFPMLRVPTLPDNPKNIESFIASDRVSITLDVAEKLEQWENWSTKGEWKRFALNQARSLAIDFGKPYADISYVPILPSLFDKKFLSDKVSASTGNPPNLSVDTRKSPTHPQINQTNSVGNKNPAIRRGPFAVSRYIEDFCSMRDLARSESSGDRQPHANRARKRVAKIEQMYSK